MSNLDFDMDNVISTLNNNAAGHLNQTTLNNIIQSTPVIETITAGATSVITASATSPVLFNTASATNLSRYTYVAATGVLTIVQAGTYRVDYQLQVSSDAAAAATLTSSVQLGTTNITGSLSNILLGTAVANDVYTLTGGVTSTFAAGAVIRIAILKGEANAGTVEIGSAFQIYNIA